MSIKLIAASWKATLPATDKLVLLALADWANGQGKCWPSIPALAAKTGLSQRAVYEAMPRLADAGHISREVKVGKGVIYTVNPCARCTPDPCASRTPAPNAPLRQVQDTPAPGAPNTVIEPRESITATPSYSPTSADSVEKKTAGFDAFWDAYPRKVGKGAAEKSYLIACRVIPPDRLLKAAAAYAASREGEDPQFTPHPATWLNQRRFDDPIEDTDHDLRNIRTSVQPDRNRSPGKRGDDFHAALAEDLADVGRRRRDATDPGGSSGDRAGYAGGAGLRLVSAGAIRS